MGLIPLVLLCLFTYNPVVAIEIRFYSDKDCEGEIAGAATYPVRFNL
jgi:hypothetical protein